MSERMQRVAGRIMATNKSGFWPSTAHWVEAAKYCGDKEEVTLSDAADKRANLSPAENELLEQVLTTAKRWLHKPELQKHAIQTLEQWNEPYALPEKTSPEDGNRNADGSDAHA